ncbi:hypothetical protein TSUD_360450 [Trifolium subterraneum]|uniref:Uncharacterized protein n=1 Tax=Trifolium subterraneum TaxID=3900 RepID=A0A2Z6N1J4_TRISU|nr:hypothetical protein TSUD_360450 [Trifolium subterraneum]
MEDQQCVMKPKQINSSSLLPPPVTMMGSPGMGHLIPMIEFAKRLINHHNLHVTFIIPTDGPPSKAQTTVLTSLPCDISHIFLPPITLSGLPPNTKIEPLISPSVLRSLPSLRHTLLSLTSTHRISSLTVDLVDIDAFNVVVEFNIPPYVFIPSPTIVLSFAFYLPQLDQEVQCEFIDHIEPINILGSRQELVVPI